MSKATAMIPATLTRPMTVKVPATAPVLEKKLDGVQQTRLIGEVFTYPEEEVDCGAVEGVRVGVVKTTTDEERPDRPAAVATYVGVEDE